MRVIERKFCRSDYNRQIIVAGVALNKCNTVTVITENNCGGLLRIRGPFVTNDKVAIGFPMVAFFYFKIP